MPPDDYEEKSHYSYNEMMDRLKESRSGGRGSSGKKRRRSEQTPPPKSRKFQLMAIGAAILIILVLAVPIAMLMMSRGQYDTDAFRRSISDRVSNLIGKSADFGPFRMQGNSLFSKRLGLIDDSGSQILRQVEVLGLRADFETTLHRGTEWPVKKLAMTRAQVVLGTRSDGTPVQRPPSGVQITKPMFGLDPNPSAIVVSDLYVRELDLAWGPPKAYDTLRGAKLQAQIAGESATWQLADGRLRFGELEELTVFAMTGDLANDKLTITRGAIGYSKKEHGTVNGEIDLGPAGGARLHVTLTNISLFRWLDLHHKQSIEKITGLAAAITRTDAPPWERRIRAGILSLDALYVSSFAADAENPSLSGSFTVRDLILRDWHLFSTMGFAFSESALNNLRFEPIAGDFKWTDGQLEVSNLKAEHRGLIKVEGSFTITDDPDDPALAPTVSGKLNIGLPAVDLGKLPGGYPDYFSPPADGFGWTEVNLTGPLDEPRHDFSERLPAEIRESLPLAPWEMTPDTNSN